MNLLSSLRSYLLLTLFFAGVIIFSPKISRAQSAIDAALKAAPTQSGSVVEHALYVRVRQPFAKGDLATFVQQLTQRAGLTPRAISRFMPAVQLAAKQNVAHLQSVSPERRNEISKLNEALGRVVEVYFGDDLSPAQAAARLEQLPEVEYAEPVPIPHTLGSPVNPNDSLYPVEDHLKIIKAPQAWQVWAGDTNMVIGIVDAGVDMYHPDLFPNIKENLGETGLDAMGNDKRANGLDDDGDGVADDWKGANLNVAEDHSIPGNTKGNSHGTAVSGLAAAATDNQIGVASVSNRCRFFPVKTQPTNSGGLTKAYAGIQYCAEHGMKVINCSWGGTDYSQTSQDFISDIVATYDVAIVAAGGNDEVYSPEYPAGFKGVLGVGAVDALDTFRTTWGEQIGVASPVGWTTTENNTYSYAPIATSFSTPVVSGVMALVRSKFPALTAEQAIAHVRLTADNMDSANLGTLKLSGYGRVNAYRAVSTDPFSHPAIVVDTLWITDATGTVRQGLDTGRTGKIFLRIRNILGPATNLRLTVTQYVDDTTGVSINAQSITVGSLATGQSAVIPTGIPFRLDSAFKPATKLRVEFVADNDYSDYQYVKERFYFPRTPYALYSTDKITLTLTDEGNLGYADYPNHQVGKGVTFEGQNFIYEGGFMVATDANHILSNVRATDFLNEDQDFTVEQLPSSANDSTTVLSDAGISDGRKIGLQMSVHVITDKSIPEAVAIQFRTKNVSGHSIDSLHVAMFADWDVDGIGDSESVMYRTNPAGSVPFYGAITGPLHVVTSGVAQPVGLPIFYAINNALQPVDIYHGFDPTKKWLTLSNGVGSAEIDNADVSLVDGKVATNLAAGAEDTTLFVIGISQSEATAAQAMKELATGLTTGIADAGIMDNGLLGLFRPNPAGNSTTVHVGNARGGTLQLFDALGRAVADYSSAITQSGEASVRIDVSALASGVYYLRLSARDLVVSRQIVVAH